MHITVFTNQNTVSIFTKIGNRIKEKINLHVKIDNEFQKKISPISTIRFHYSCLSNNFVRLREGKIF